MLRHAYTIIVLKIFLCLTQLQTFGHHSIDDNGTENYFYNNSILILLSIEPIDFMILYSPLNFMFIVRAYTNKKVNWWK